MWFRPFFFFWFAGGFKNWNGEKFEKVQKYYKVIKKKKILIKDKKI